MLAGDPQTLFEERAMKIILDGKGKPRAEPTPEDEWCILVFETGPEKDKITIVGPYDTMTRPEADPRSWIRRIPGR